MPTKKIKRKKYREYMISSSSHLNTDLCYLRSRTAKPNRIILEEIICPLTSILRTKYDAGYNIIVENDKIIIQAYARNPVYFNGQNVPMNQVFNSITKETGHND